MPTDPAAPQPTEEDMEKARDAWCDHTALAPSEEDVEWLARLRAEARAESNAAWKREAEDFESGVNEFDCPIAPDHEYHEVRDWLADAWSMGCAVGRERGYRAGVEACAQWHDAERAGYYENSRDMSMSEELRSDHLAMSLAHERYAKKHRALLTEQSEVE